MSPERDPAPLMRAKESTSRAAIALGLGLYLAQIPLYWSYITDDSYIYARMAQNLAQRGQLVFNPDQWVNAATSPLWAILGACGAWL
ncbi:MAG TPA: hypothetical protein VKA63_00315, partial [Candidatus Krumholzibacteria bacterium]|nr:hypothetical protein [Candidatus Krumholzibacteria bacterium]